MLDFLVLRRSGNIFRGNQELPVRTRVYEFLRRDILVLVHRVQIGLV